MTGNGKAFAGRQRYVDILLSDMLMLTQHKLLPLNLMCEEDRLQNFISFLNVD